MESTRNLRLASNDAFVARFSASLMFAVWQPFVLQLGVPMSTLRLWKSLTALHGLVRFPAHYLGGQLDDKLGFRDPFLANWAGLLVALAVLVFSVKEPRLHEEAP